MTVGDMKKMNLPDDTEIEINSVWNKEKQEFTPTSCDGVYHKKDKKIYLTPDVISIWQISDDVFDELVKELIPKQ